MNAKQTETKTDSHFRSMADRLKAHGFEASKGNLTQLFPEDLDLAKSIKDPHFDGRELLSPMPDFVEDVRANGVNKPIVVQLIENKDQTITLRVWAGRQRTQAAMIVNADRVKAKEERRKVPVDVRRASDAEMGLLAIAENWQRPESVMSKAVKVRKALDAGATKESIRVALRCAPNTVDDLLRFLDLSTEVQAAIEGGQLPLGTIKVMAEVPKAEQAAMLDQVKAAGATKIHEIKATVANTKAATGKAGAKPAALPETKKVLSRVKIEQWAAVLHEEFKDDVQAQMAFQMLSFILGYRGALKKLPTVKQAAEMCGIATREGQEDTVKAAAEGLEF